jgi:putative Ca2+/H+ antiporter (TMEM165/GDT1 family)
VFVTTATTVFLAELGDKTQLAALLLSAQSGQPLVVFAGASLALICSSLVGVVLGRWLARLLAPELLERLAGILMVVLGLWLVGQAILDLAQLQLRPTASPRPAGLHLLATVFLAELGDKTQLAIVTISGTSSRPGAVFAGSAQPAPLASLVGAAGIPYRA